MESSWVEGFRDRIWAAILLDVQGEYAEISVQENTKQRALKRWSYLPRFQLYSFYFYFN